MQDQTLSLIPDHNVSKNLKGKITLPASKSITNRALVIEALSKKDFSFQNLSKADDSKLMNQLLHSKSNILDCKNAGTVFRFLTAYLAIQDRETILTGNERMKSRPIKPLVNALNTLGCNITYLEKEGFPPLKIKGHPIKGGKITIDSSLSSQFISALLLIAPYFQSGLNLTLTGNQVSTPYITMTLKMMNFFGIETRFHKETITVFSGHYQYKNLVIENDWSSASYFFALAALFPGSQFSFYGLHKGSWQGDHRLISYIKNFRIETNFKQDQVEATSKKKSVEKFSADFIENPDLVQTFVVLCTLKKVPFYLTGVDHLRYKETDRLVAIKNELTKIGGNLEIKENMIFCNHFTQPINPEGIIKTYNDHRMAMSFALAACVHPELQIEQPEVVNKSFPGFWENFENLGFALKKN